MNSINNELKIYSEVEKRLLIYLYCEVYSCTNLNDLIFYYGVLNLILHPEQYLKQHKIRKSIQSQRNKTL